MSVENVAEGSSPEKMRLVGDFPGDAGARTVARRTGDLGRRIVGYVFGRDPGVKHLATYGTVGALIGGAVGFGIGGLAPGAVVGAFLGATFFDGLALVALATSRPRVGYRPGESRDDNGEESDGESVDSGSTARTEEVETAVSILNEGLSTIPESIAWGAVAGATATLVGGGSS
ncbi:MAG: hypothetical protein OXF02_02380 [Simkaniaceae bacterium]|nr:hypothetical protein [Simkaniaceae bacterium]